MNVNTLPILLELGFYHVVEIINTNVNRIKNVNNAFLSFFIQNVSKGLLHSWSALEWRYPPQIHCVSKKVPTFKLYVTLSNVNQFSKFLHCWKAYEICYKIIQYYPAHLRHVGTLPWETENANFLHIFSAYERKCKQIAFLSPLSLLFIHKFRYFQCLK